MVKTKAQKKHGRGEGRRTAGFDEVAARNQDFVRETREERDQRLDKNPKKVVEETSEEESEEEEKEKAPVEKKSKKKEPVVEEEEVTAIGMEGNESTLTRVQREELEKADAKRRYEKLHKEGKTDEAMSDLARLAEVKARREKQKLEREESEKLAAEKLEAAKGGRNDVLKALGGDAARMRGDRSKENKKKKDTEKQEKQQEKEIASKRGVNDDMLYIPYANIGMNKEKGEDAQEGTIEGARQAEEDFM